MQMWTGICGKERLAEVRKCSYLPVYPLNTHTHKKKEKEKRGAPDAELCPALDTKKS